MSGNWKWLAALGALWAGAGLDAAIAAKPAGTNAIAAEAAPAEAERPRGPAIWLLADEDTKIYLFGTIHILPPGLEWRTAELDRVIEEVDELVMETGEEREAEPEDTALDAMLMLGKNVPVIERVSPEYRPALAAILSQSMIGEEAYDGMQTWAVALMLGMEQMMLFYGELAAEQGIEGEGVSGVEDVLTEIFKESQRPISGVETDEEQMGFMSGLSLATQRELLESTVAGWDEAAAALEPDEPAWMNGDVDTIGEEMRAFPPELYDRLLTRRNAAWTEWLVRRLDQPGSVLFAVGAGHLAGPDSVQTMLEARGLRVERLH